MRYHDFHLSGYSVRDFYGEIVLHLLYDYPPQPREESHIRFGDLAFYHFVHTAGAIILDIAEVPLAEGIEPFVDRIAEWSRVQGLPLWEGDAKKYQTSLDAESYRAWNIGGNIGFNGFIIAKTIEDVTSKYATGV